MDINYAERERADLERKRQQHQGRLDERKRVAERLEYWAQRYDADEPVIAGAIRLVAGDVV